MNSEKVILDLYAGSGSWSQPYVDAGYAVVRVEYEGLGADVRLLEKQDIKVHGILAAPPCTHFASSGARWWKEKGNKPLLNGLSTVDAVLRLVWVYKPVWWALENPIGRLVHYLGRPKFTFDPCDFGEPWTKKTCLWGEFQEPKKNRVKPTMGSALHKLSSSRKDLRAETPPGFAQAFFEANP